MYLGSIRTLRQGNHLLLKILKITTNVQQSMYIYTFHKQNVYPTSTVL